MQYFYALNSIISQLSVNALNAFCGYVNRGIISVGERAGVEKCQAVIDFKVRVMGVAVKNKLGVFFSCGEIERGQPTLDIIGVAVGGENSLALGNEKL